MIRFRLLSILLVFGFLCCSSGLYAQVTTATLSGTVTDSNGEPLVAANVVAKHEPSGTLYGVSTREDGGYTLPNLRIGGPYTMSADYVGYKPQSFDNINLAIGQKLNLDFSLESEAVTTAEAVVIANADPILNSERTGAATNIGSEQITNLPTISRSASDYYRLSPSASGNSFGGRNDQFNNFSLDGSIFNNPFGLDAATPGGQTESSPVSLDAIDQIQVSLAPYDVTQAGFTGAAVNAVTKSGTNEFSGTVFGFWRNQDLTGKKVRDTDLFVGDLTQYQAGFSLGGPIVKDKVFFFINAEIDRREDLGSNFIANRDNIDAVNESRVLASDLDAISSALMSRFGYDTGAYENYKHQTESLKGIVKLDFNLSNNHKLTATYNFLDAFKDKPAHPSALGRRGPDATTLQFENSGYTINNVIHSGILELNSIFGNKFSNNLQVGYTAFLDSRDPFSTPFPVVNINRDGIRYIVAGHEPFSINNRLDQYVLQATNNFNIYAGSHTVTIGTSIERFEFDNSFNLDAYGGSFGPGFGSVQEFLDLVNSGGFDADVAAAQSTFETNNANDSWALAETNVGQWAAYLQDAWDVNDDLTITYGVRMDLPLYFDTPTKIQENIDRNCCYDPTIQWYDTDGTPVMFDHTVLPKQTPLISPRVGFNWDVNGDGATQLRGGSGLFSGRLPFVWIGNQVANPNWFFYNITDRDFKFPQAWRTNVGWDQKMGNGWTVSSDFIYTRDVNGMMVRNYGLTPPSGTLVGVDNRPIYSNASDRTLVFGGATNAYVFTNTDVGSQVNIILQGQKTWDNGMYAMLAYNFLASRDASSIEAEISSDAYDRNPAFGHVNEAVASPSLYGNRHRFIGAFYKRFGYANDKMGTTISMFFEYARGGRFSYTYSGDINNDGSGLNDLIYIPTTTDLGNMQFSGTADEANAQRAALNAFIEQDAYLSQRRGLYAEKYSILSPWYGNWDLRILQDFNFDVGNKTQTIQISADILNFGNLLSSSLGVRQNPTNTQPIGVSVDGNGVPTYSFDTALTNSFTDDFSLLSRWQLRLGLRYIF
ncbi:MAG: TonB-dependent receptor [Bacteroidota bacterium]